VSDTFLRAHVSLLAGLVPLLVRLFPLPQLLKLLTPPARRTPYRSVAPERVVEIVQRRLADPRHMRRRACLREGITAFHFLSLAGFEPELRFGVFPPGPAQRRMHAHCWIELDGRALTAPPAGPCPEMMRYRRAGGLAKATAQ
jgi:hypothetical protein